MLQNCNDGLRHKLWFRVPKYTGFRIKPPTAEADLITVSRYILYGTPFPSFC